MAEGVGSVQGLTSRIRDVLAPGAVGCRCGFGGYLYVFSCSREAVTDPTAEAGGLC
ncbi:MAG: hypothetical protein AB1816_02430 [Bacillota bacterium]